MSQRDSDLERFFGMTYATENGYGILGVSYGAGSLKTVAKALAKYNLDLVAVQEVKKGYGKDNYYKQNMGKNSRQ